MRAFACLGFLILGAACGDGVHIEIVVPDGVTSVDLFLATGTCDFSGQGCDGIAPPSSDPNTSRTALPGTVFHADADEPFRATVENGSAWFYLSPRTRSGEDGGAHAVKFAIAVGHDGSSSDVGLAMLDHRIDLAAGEQYYAAALIPATAPLGDDAPAAVEEWPRGDVPYACVGGEIGGQRVFIVPENDPDCDRVDSALECSPFVHLAIEPPGTELADLTCAENGFGADPCQLGDRGCDERSLQKFSCTRSPTTYCVPDAACLCSDLDSACVSTLFEPADITSPPTATEIVCFLETEVTNIGPAVHTCNNITPSPALITAAPCGAVEIMPAAVGFSFAQSTDVTTSVGGFTLTPKTISPGCNFTLDPPNADFESTINEEFQSFVKIDMLDGATIILPLVVVLGGPGSCSVTESKCQLRAVPTEKVTTCVGT